MTAAAISAGQDQAALVVAPAPQGAPALPDDPAPESRASRTGCAPEFGLGELAWLEREGSIGKGRHHLTLFQEAKIAAVRRVGVLAVFLRQGGEISALVQLGDDLFRLLFGINENVPRVHLLLAWLAVVLRGLP